MGKKQLQTKPEYEMQDQENDIETFQNVEDIQTSRRSRQKEYQSVLPIAEHLKKYNEIQEENQKKLATYCAMSLIFIAIIFLSVGIKFIFFPPKQVVVAFLGDQITAGGRDATIKPKKSMSQDEAREYKRSQLGEGYVVQSYEKAQLMFGEEKLHFVNMGLTDNNMSKLLDNIAELKVLQPNIITILIGAHDCLLHVQQLYKEQKSQGKENNKDITKGDKQDSSSNQNQEELQQDVDIRSYMKNFNQLIKILQKYLPNTIIIIGEPFAFEGKLTNQYENFFPELEKYQKFVQNLEKDLKGVKVIPYQSLFNIKLKSLSNMVEFFSTDGINPSFFLQDEMAIQWLNYSKSYINYYL